MKELLICLITAILFTHALQASAFECTNAATEPFVPPDDTGDSSAVACGPSSFAGGSSSIAVGLLASSPGEDSIALGVDSASGGSSSTAVGISASAAGINSIAVGPSASSAGASGVALGNGASASQSSSVALGFASSASGQFATALGNESTAFSNHSLAAGTLALASGFGSVALGYESDALGGSSVAIGRLADAPQGGSTAVGFTAAAEASDSLALGRLSRASGARSTALGYRAFASQPDTVVLGQIAGQNEGNAYADVAIGTTTPLAPLHIFRDDGTAQVLVEETSTDAVPRTLFRLASAGSNAKFEIDNTLAGVNWAFTNAGSDFRISRQGSGIVEFRVFNNGDAFIAGDLDVGGDLFTNVLLPSDENLKQNVEAIDPETVLEKVAALPVTAWEYSDRPGQRHIGPMAQDFHAAFGLGSGDTAISVVDASGVALASIQALEARNRQLEQEVVKLSALKVKNAELEERLALIEAMLTQLLPQTAQN